MMLFKRRYLIAFALISLCSVFQVRAEDKISVFLYNENDPFIKQLDKDYKDIAKNLDQKIDIKYTNNDVLYEKQLINDNVFLKSSGIVINPVDPNNVDYIIKLAKKYNKPIVFINRKPDDSLLNEYDKAYFVGTESEDAGRMQGTILNMYAQKHKLDKNNDNKIQCILFSGEPNHQDTILRTKGLMDFINLLPYEVKIVNKIEALWRYDLARDKFSQYILTHDLSKIECIFSNNDQMALGALSVLLDHGYNSSNNKYIPIIGTDAINTMLQAIAEKRVVGTVKNDAKNQALISIQVINLLNKGQSVDKMDIQLDNKKSIYIPYNIITNM